MTPLLEARGVALGARLAPTSLSSPGGELVGLVGPNGGGKTSLLRALARVEEAEGRVQIDGEDLDSAPEARRRRLIAFLPASREVAWPIGVRDVIALGGGDDRRIAELLDAFDLQPLARRTIGSLSTGERARALLARALASRPRLLLLDEPLANLDPYWTLRTLDLLAAEAVRGASVMVALHDLGAAERFDRLLLLEQGKIIADGPPSAVGGRMATLFGVEAAPGGGWRLPTPPADRRSSP